mgnify:FL=1
MKLTFAPKGILQFDDAMIIHKNFTGVGSPYNREGDRNFSIVINDEEIANALIEEGWNVKIRAPRDADDMPFMFLPVKVKFNDRGPVAYLKSGNNVVKLDEESIAAIDNVDIESVDLDVRPYDWDVNGKTGRTAYLQAIHVVQRVDRFAGRYEEPQE